MNKWSMAWRAALCAFVIVIIAILIAMLGAVAVSQWNWQLIPDILKLWPIFLVLLVVVVLLFTVMALYPVQVLVTSFIAFGLLLLMASSKGTMFNETIAGWISKNWDINLLSASITVFSLAFAIAAVTSARRNKE